MQTVWIVTKDEKIAETIGTGLDLDHVLEAYRIPHFNSPVPSAFGRPDLLILDLKALNQDPDNLLRQMKNIYPDVPHIALAPAQEQPTREEWLQLGLDEVITRPENQGQTDQMLSSLRQSLAALEHMVQVKKKLFEQMHLSRFVAKSKPMRDILRSLPQLAQSTSSVLITGETGTGKELFARAIHYLGPRAKKPFITLDCGALPDNLVENELFGHARGAYTDAGQPSKGLLQEAHGGTLFLDEIEALPDFIQPKFLRFLQERQYRPLGQTSYITVDVRVLAATNTDLSQAVKQKTFREDLYYRLNVLPLAIPPLRERKSDIPVLARHFLHKYADSSQAGIDIPDETVQRWMAYDWPGNVRELENRVQEWLHFGSRQERETADSGERPRHRIRSLAEERRDALTRCDCLYLQNLLTQTKGNISAASRLAGIDRKNLRQLLKKYDINKERFCR